MLGNQLRYHLLVLMFYIKSFSMFSHFHLHLLAVSCLNCRKRLHLGTPHSTEHSSYEHWLNE